MKQKKTLTRRKKYPKVQRKGRIPVSWKIDYQYSENMQQMGPGTTTKNFERFVTVQPNTQVIFDVATFANQDDLDQMCRAYRYIKVVGIGITQNAMNLANEQDSVYLRVAWSGNTEQESDILEDDASKILPNIGRKRFIFSPPKAQIPLYRNGSTISANLSEFVSTSILETTNDKYTIPGSIMIYNTTSTARKLRIIMRIIFRGSKVIDKVEEAKRVLKNNGYLVQRIYEDEVDSEGQNTINTNKPEAESASV